MIRYLRLGDVCLDIVDCPHETPEWKKSGIAVIRNFNLVDGRIDMRDGFFVDEETYLRRTQRVVPSEGDIIFSREAPIGNCAIVPANFKCCLGQRLVLLRINHDICSSEYLLVALQSPYVRLQIDQVSRRGSIVSNFAIGDLRELIIPILDNQCDVADYYCTISDKIQNNKIICSDLEAMAKLLYDYWFVQFDFPDENGKPYKSSGGKMVWSEELKREIPAGWEAGTLGDVLKRYSDGIDPKSIGELPYTPMDILPMRQMSFSEAGSKDDANSSLIRYSKHSILFGAMRPYFHRVCISPFDGVTRTTVFTLQEKNKGELGYAYETLNQDYAVEYANAHHVGTQQPYAEWENNLEKCPIPLPPSALRKKYSDLIIASIDAVIDRNLENQQLGSLRDFLLPMLMNGQVKVVN